MFQLKKVTQKELRQILENPNPLIRSGEKAEHSADVRRIDLKGYDLRDEDLRGASLRNCNLRDANLSFSNLKDVDLRGASLENAILRNSDSISVNVNGDIYLKLRRTKEGEDAHS